MIHEKSKLSFMSGKIDSARSCVVSVDTQIQAADRLGLVWSGDRILEVT